MPKDFSPQETFTEPTQESQQDAPTQDTNERDTELEDLRQERDKALNDLKSLQGGRQKQQERDNLLQGIADRQEAQDQKIDVLFRAQVGDGDTESTTQEYQQINQESQQRRQTSNWESFYQSSWEELHEVVQSVKDKDNNPSLDLMNGPELEPMRRDWMAAVGSKDRAGIERALRMAERTANAKEKEILATRTTNPPDNANGRRRRDTESPPSSWWWGNG